MDMCESSHSTIKTAAVLYKGIVVSMQNKLVLQNEIWYVLGSKGGHMLCICIPYVDGPVATLPLDILLMNNQRSWTEIFWLNSIQSNAAADQVFRLLEIK